MMEPPSDIRNGFLVPKNIRKVGFAEEKEPIEKEI